MWPIRSVGQKPADLARLLCTVGILIFAGLGSIRPIADPDLFWHLHTGDWIRANLAIPSVDSFSHTFGGQPLHLVDWLADVLLSFLYDASGFAGIHALAAILASALLLVAVLRTRHPRMPAALLTLGMLLIYAGSAARIYSRPQTFGLLLVSVEVLLLERAAERERPWRLLFGVLPALFCLWSNLHGSSPLGLAILAIFAVGDLWTRRRAGASKIGALLLRWAGLLLASTAGLMLASNPLGRIGIGLALTGSRVFHSVITEWRPTEWQVLLGPVGLLAAMLLLGLLLNVRRVRLWEWLLVIFSAYLASTAWRFVPFFVLLAGPVGLRHLAGALNSDSAEQSRVAPAVDKGGAALLLIGAFAVAFAFNCSTAWLGGAVRPAGGLAPLLFPEDATSFIARERPAGRLFNSFHWGGYLMWAVPGLPVFIDGRTETLYDESFLKENTDLTPATWRQTFAKYQVDWAIVLPSVLQEDIARDPDWTTVYFDDVCAILIRKGGPNRAIVDRFGYRLVMPDGLRPPTERSDNAEVVIEARRAVEAAPRSGRAHCLLANALLVEGDRAGYEKESAEALKMAPQLATVWYRVGLGHALTGGASARAEIEHAVMLAPYSSQFRETLALICFFQHDLAAAERALAPVLQGRTMVAAMRQLADSPLGQTLRAAH